MLLQSHDLYIENSGLYFCTSIIFEKQKVFFLTNLNFTKSFKFIPLVRHNKKLKGSFAGVHCKKSCSSE